MLFLIRIGFPLNYIKLDLQRILKTKKYEIQSECKWKYIFISNDIYFYLGFYLNIK